ncbi:hypothetical protein CTJTET1_02650 [Chlamydia trachomatis J/6276tet1]|nr:hypothetical protein CTJTET1_02650 [Chlamydia trachomatis J/6276tet1]
MPMRTGKHPILIGFFLKVYRRLSPGDGKKFTMAVNFWE